jgi:hypothetical protein
MAEKLITRIKTDVGNLRIDYNALANKPDNLELDSTLTKSGKAADAKIVGDKLKEIQTDVGNVSLPALGVTASVTELNYMDGVTSNVQTQLNGKAASEHTHSDLANATHSHDASDISSGILPIDKGGTGANTADDALYSLGAQPKLLVNDVQLSTTVAVPSGTPTPVAETVVLAGRYLVFGGAEIPGWGGDPFAVYVGISEDGTFNMRSSTSASIRAGEAQTRLNCIALCNFSENTRISVAVSQNSGSTIDVSAASLTAIKI